jgi:SAM-dependent methyltransferase
MTAARPTTAAEMYEHYFVPAIFGPWARALLKHAAPQPGERVLDLACGTGIVARQVAPVVGTAGSVVGLDLRPGMLVVARTRPAPAGAVISWQEGEANALPFADGSFDLVLCQQGLQFFPDRLAALREVRRVLRPGGRVGLAIWQALHRQGLFWALIEAEARHLAFLGVTREQATAPFSLGDAEEIVSLLQRAELDSIEIVPASQTVFLPAPDDFVANAEFAYGAVDPHFVANPLAFADFVAAVNRDTEEDRKRYRRDDHLVFPMHAHIAVGYR